MEPMSGVAPPLAVANSSSCVGSFSLPGAAARRPDSRPGRGLPKTNSRAASNKYEGGYDRHRGKGAAEASFGELYCIMKLGRPDGGTSLRYMELTWWVPLVKFSAGAAVVIGFVAPLAALGLLVIILVASAISGRERLKAYKPIDRADRIDDWLYLPETLYAFILIMVISAGAGPYSLDAVILRNVR